MTEVTGSKLVEQQEGTIKEKLSDEEMGNLLSAFGNSEAKGITLGTMRDGNIYSKGNLHRAVINIQGEEKGWEMNRGTPIYYCKDSLSPIGLVTRETINADLSVFGYQITEYGKRVGLPLAGLLLDFSQRHNIPLKHLFGISQSSSNNVETILTQEGEEGEFRKRSPMTRFKIFYELITGTLPIKEVDLMQAIRESHTLSSSHLIPLAENGIIKFESRGYNKPYSYYKYSSTAPQEEPKSLKRAKTLTSNIYQILKGNQNKYFSARDVYNLLPEEIRKNWIEEHLINQITSTFSYFLSKKYCEIKQFSKDTQTDIDLSYDQAAMLTALIEIIDRFQNQDPEIIMRGRQLLEAILADPHAISSLLRRTKTASNYANSLPRTETVTLINSLLQSHPEGLGIYQIQELIEKDSGRKLATRTIHDLTGSLEKSGSVFSKREGKAKRFFSGVQKMSVGNN